MSSLFCIQLCGLCVFAQIPAMKRLKGWKLEKETGGAKSRKAASLEKAELHSDPLEKEYQDLATSGLACKLLSLWSCGVLSAVLCQQLVHLALQDGAQHQDLLRLAMAGHWGQHQGNCHRDFMRFCGQVALSSCHRWSLVAW